MRPADNLIAPIRAVPMASPCACKANRATVQTVPRHRTLSEFGLEDDSEGP